MTREAKHHTARISLKKVLQGMEDPDGIDNLVESCLGPKRAQEQVLDEIGRWLLAIRESNKQGALPARFPLPRVISAFQKAAQKRNISTEKFYPALLERVLMETEAEDAGAVAPKRSTMEKILDAALEVFSEKGFHLAIVDEIAERAGVGKGTLYRYFANKETLFNELVRLRLEELEKKGIAIWDEHDDALTMITKYLRIYFEFFDRNQHLYRVIVQERPDVGDQVQDVYLKKVIRRTPHLRLKIYEATKQGVLKDVDFQTVFYGVMGFVHGVIQKWLSRDCAYSLVDELPGVVEVLFYGFVKSSKETENR